MFLQGTWYNIPPFPQSSSSPGSPLRPSSSLSPCALALLSPPAELISEHCSPSVILLGGGFSWKTITRELPYAWEESRACSYKARSTKSHPSLRVVLLRGFSLLLSPSLSARALASLSPSAEFISQYCAPSVILLGGCFSWTRTASELPRAEEGFRACS